MSFLLTFRTEPTTQVNFLSEGPSTPAWASVPTVGSPLIFQREPSAEGPSDFGKVGVHVGSRRWPQVVHHDDGLQGLGSGPRVGAVVLSRRPPKRRTKYVSDTMLPTTVGGSPCPLDDTITTKIDTHYRQENITLPETSGVSSIS